MLLTLVQVMRKVLCFVVLMNGWLKWHAKRDLRVQRADLASRKAVAERQARAHLANTSGCAAALFETCFWQKDFFVYIREVNLYDKMIFNLKIFGKYFFILYRQSLTIFILLVYLVRQLERLPEIINVNTGIVLFNLGFYRNKK